VRTELEQTEESGEDVSAHADLQNADICPIPALKPSLRQLLTQRARRRFFAKVPATVGTTAGACAGVSTLRYKALSMSEEPFLCPSCTADRHRQCIHEQQQAIRELQGCVRSLGRGT